MTLEAVFLDATPYGLATQRPGKSPEADACIAWVVSLTEAGINVFVPAIADYEIRREVLRANTPNAAKRLNVFLYSLENRFLPLTPEALFEAARLWAEARNRGIPTADNKALDGDVILAAQVLTSGMEPDSFLVATENVRHLSRYVPCADWKDIRPTEDGA